MGEGSGELLKERLGFVSSAWHVDKDSSTHSVRTGTLGGTVKRGTWRRRGKG